MQRTTLAFAIVAADAWDVGQTGAMLMAFIQWQCTDCVHALAYAAAVVLTTCCAASRGVPAAPSVAASEAPNYPKAVDLETLHADCAKERAVACLAFAERLYWKGLDHRAEERHESAEKACRLGEPDGCAMAGVRNMFSSGGESLAHQQLVKGCDEGSFMACYAVMRWWPAEVNPAQHRVVPLLEASCQRGVGSHCVIAGVLVTSGYAQTADPVRGRSLLQSGCEADKSNCLALAAFHASGKLIGSDPSAAAGLCTEYRRAMAARSTTPGECPSSFENFVDDMRGALTPL
jgi:hypothetical protein